MENTQVDWTQITKEEFQAYEAVRSSGVTNMWDVRVEGLSRLHQDTILAIMGHYSDLDAKYPDVRK